MRFAPTLILLACRHRGECWESGPDLNVPRELSGTVVLDDGRLLVVGGHPLNEGWELIDSNEIFDPDDQTWSLVAPTHVPRNGGTATVLLNDGRVLVSDQYDVEFAHDPSEVYDPETDTWTLTGAMPGAPTYGPLVALPDGDALSVGGIDWSIDTPLDQVLRYQAATGEWAEMAPLPQPNHGHRALLVGEDVLVFGGDGAYPTNEARSTTWLYSPAEDAWREVGPMTQARWGPRSVLLDDGRVLVAGGTSGHDISTDRTATVEIYDPSTETWAETEPLEEARAMLTLTLLADGRVLAAGGYDDEDLDSAEVWDPRDGTWSSAGSFKGPRRLHTAARLQAGEVLLVGGYHGKQLATTEIYRCDP